MTSGGTASQSCVFHILSDIALCSQPWSAEVLEIWMRRKRKSNIWWPLTFRNSRLIDKLTQFHIISPISPWAFEEIWSFRFFFYQLRLSGFTNTSITQRQRSWGTDLDRQECCDDMWWLATGGWGGRAGTALAQACQAQNAGEIRPVMLHSQKKTRIRINSTSEKCLTLHTPIPIWRILTINTT